MTINSDNDTKKPNRFVKLWNTISGDWHQTVIVSISLFVMYMIIISFPGVWIGALIAGIVMIFIGGLITNTSLFSDFKAMAWIFLMGITFTTGLWYITTSIDEQKDTLDLKPYITSIKANKNGDKFIINFKLPFESKVEITFNEQRFNKLFSDKNHLDEFNITATKTCYKYRIKDVSCSTSMDIQHKDVGDSIFTYYMTDSVYPKKLSLEEKQ